MAPPLSESGRDTAGVLIRPPLLFAGALAIGFGLARFLPFGLKPQSLPPVIWIGFWVAIAGCGTGLVLAAVRTLHRAGTPIPTVEPTRALVTDGPYAISRNPIYLGLAAIYVGIAAAFDAGAALAIFPIVLVVLHFGVISREERYLARRFASSYRDYCARVRRWL
jgi:protein-S-isoprenylcysteine O-methyltransferase Ste14